MGDLRVFRAGAVAAAALVASLSLSACSARLYPLTNQGAVLLATAQDPATVRAAIARALTARSYTTERDDPGLIVARIDNRGTTLRLKVEYSGTQWSIQYLDSQGLSYQETAQGPMINRVYGNRVQELRRAIESELGRPAREAQAAVDAQRQHELEVLEAQRRQAADAQNAETERERLRAAQAQSEADRARANADRARAQADAQRPVIIGHNAYTVAGLAFNARNAGRGSVRIAPGFTPDPRVLQGQAMGVVGAQQMNLPDGCRGFYNPNANHVVQLGGSFQYLRVETSSSVDTTLAIVAPDGSVWCDDDGAGQQNARIDGQFPAGPYRIFVGTFNQNVAAPYSVFISEAQAASAPVYSHVEQRAPVMEAPPAPAPDCRSALLAAGHHSVHMMHCDGAEPNCAVALLQAGHNPATLIHCRNVDPSCAVTLLRSGRNPVELINCPQR